MLRGLFCCLILALSALVVHADPAVITSGTASVRGVNGYARFGLSASGNNFSVNAGTYYVISSSSPDCYPCAAGSTLSLNAFSNTMRTDDLAGSVTVNVETYFIHSVSGIWLPALPEVQAQGLFSLGGGSVVIPITGEDSYILTAPFSMGGYITGSGSPNGGPLSPSNPPIQVFSLQFSGSGMASALVTRRSDGLYVFQNATYTFAAPAVVPEPTSILLICSGVLGIAVKLRSR